MARPISQRSALLLTILTCVSFLGVPAAPAGAAPPSASFDGGRLVDSGTREVGLEAGDFDEDGWPDVITANSNGTADLMLNRTDNWFTMASGWPKSATGNNQSVVTGDFNADGHLDAAVAGSTTALFRVFLGAGNGQVISSLPYSAGAGTQPFDIAAGDMNGDGTPDLVTANQANTSPASAPSVTVRFNTGSGGFAGGGVYTTGATGALSRGLAVGDVDGDGDSDVVVTNSNADQVRLLLNDGSGDLTLSPTAYSTARGPRKVVLADLDGDGDLDIATADSGDTVPALPANRDNRSTVLLNDGAGVFTAAPGSPFTVAPSAASPFAVRAVDLNGDGVLDLAFANRYGGSLSYVLGDGDGTFGSAVVLNYPDDYVDAEVTDLSVGDFNHDGKPDLLGNAAGSPGYLVPFLNTTTIAAPDVTGVDPASPGDTGSPRIQGTTDGATVSLYTTSDCSGSPAATGTASQFEGAGITVSVARGDTDTFYATTTNAAGWATSACSTSSVSYLHDPTPDAPTSLSTTPAGSPGGTLAPKVRGSAFPGSTVTVYATADCSGDPVATGSAEDFASPGLTVTAVAGANQYSATSTVTGGFTSDCSAAVSYTASAPRSSTAPTLSGPPALGRTLTATNGTWAGGPVSAYHYAWSRCTRTGRTCVPVGGDSSSYLLSRADLGLTVKVTVTAGNGVGSASRDSRLSRPIRRSR